MEIEYDYLIVGAGFYGSICAHELSKFGYKVLVIDNRNHIGGNCYDYTDEETKILMCKYGAHNFRSNDLRSVQNADDLIAGASERVHLLQLLARRLELVVRGISSTGKQPHLHAPFRYLQMLRFEKGQQLRLVQDDLVVQRILAVFRLEVHFVHFAHQVLLETLFSIQKVRLRSSEPQRMHFKHSVACDEE